MDEGDLSSLTVLLLLIVIYGLITLVYTAITNARQAHMRDLAESGRGAAKRVLRILDSLAHFTLSYQFSQVILAVIIALVAAANLAPELLASGPDTQPGVIYGGIAVGLVVLLVVIGNIIPAAIGSAYADSMSLLLSGFARLLMIVMMPVVSLMLAFSQVLANAMGGQTIAATVTEEEIMTLVNAGQKEGTIEDEEKAMIFSILQFGETLVREVMIPRMDIEALEVSTPIEMALGKFIESGHSRIPIYAEKIDNIEGLLYAKDLLSLWYNGGPKPASIAEIMRPAYFVPEDKRADLVLKEMQESKIHFAVVVDEYGGTAGIVTIENLIEEIVGDIQDEYDADEEEEFIQQGEHEYLIDASMDLDDLNNLLEVNLPTEENDTLGGFIYSKLGRVPTVGEVIDDPERNLILRVESVDGRRIRKVHVTRIVAPETDDAPALIEADMNELDSKKAG